MIFSHRAVIEADVKNFLRQKKANKTVIRKLIDHTLHTVRQSGIPFFLHHTEQQNGHSFGEKLANAIESVFEKGYSQVIAIGNDTPDLTTELIQKTEQLLNKNGCVLGPSLDGGVYLIGLKKSKYHREEFISLPWGNSELQVGWNDYEKKINLSIKWLKPLGDIDSHQDFIQFLKRKNRKIIFLIQSINNIIASYCKKNSHFTISYQKNYYYLISLLRGPPSHL